QRSSPASLRPTRVHGVGEAEILEARRPFLAEDFRAIRSESTQGVTLLLHRHSDLAHFLDALLPRGTCEFDRVLLPCALVEGVRPQHPRTLGVGRRSRAEQAERDEQWG